MLTGYGARGAVALNLDGNVTKFAPHKGKLTFDERVVLNRVVPAGDRALLFFITLKSRVE